MPIDYDAIVIGSGFGGAVMACRLAEREQRVLVLERGRRWEASEYPRRPGDAWIWDENEPEKRDGWIDLRVFPRMAVVQGAGVGGGSLIYANVSINAQRRAFDRGWPPEITYDALLPYYDRVSAMIEPMELPDGQQTERFKLMRQAAERTGHADRFQAVPLAVRFDQDWRYDKPDPFNTAHSRRVENAYGKVQGTCIHCGNCDIGCPVHAKNTLDLNYLARAERLGTEIRPKHRVRLIAPLEQGYRVEFDELRDGRRRPGHATAARVFLAAGSLGSTELLLRCRDQYRTLPRISRRLGMGWSSNGDFLTPAYYPQRRVSPTQGPTITCAMDFLDGSEDGAEFFVEDGGFPDVVGNYLEAMQSKWSFLSCSPFTRSVRRLRKHLRGRDPLPNIMPWFGQGMDASDGRLRLHRPWWWPFTRRLTLDWRAEGKSEQAIDGLYRMHRRLSAATGGDPLEPLTWTWGRYLITPHPLNGCGMGTDPSNGVVDHRGEVFGYPRLYVCDGAIVPRPVGLNPSKTIAALAERIAEHIEA